MTETPTSKSHVPLEDSLPQAPLESILYTEELQRRPSRPPDYEKEIHALVRLGSAFADSPTTIFQTLAETILDITQCDSAGLSLLTKDGKTPDVCGERFYWPAIAGVWNPHVGGGTPRNFGPCGDVLDQNRTLLFRHFERRYPYLLPVIPAAEECLLVPFYVAGKAVGTIWAIMHSDRRKFDGEDDRLMACLGKFASSAYQARMHIEDLKMQVAEREKAEAELRKLSESLERQVRARTAELQSSEERLRLAQRAARIGTFEWNIQTGVNIWTPELEEMYGLSPRGFGGTQTAFENLVCPDDRAGVIALNNCALKTGLPTTGEWRVVWPDGSVHWIAGSWQVFMNESGQPSRMLGMNIDITERKRAEEKLREYEKAVEGAEDIIGVVDREYRLLLANRQYLKMRNMTREQVVGRHVSDVLTNEIFETVIKPKLDECFKGKVVKYESKFSYPGVGERDLLLSYFPIEGANGTIDRVACISRDITERKQTEDAMREMNRSLEEKNALLQAHEELLRVFVKNVPAAVAMLDRDMRYMQVSDRWCTDYLPGIAEILGRSHYELFPNMPERWKEVHLRCLQGETLRADEDRWDGQDGVHWARWEVRPWKTAGDIAGGILILAEDITRRKQMEEALSGMSRKLVEAHEQERAHIGRELHDDINQRLALLNVELAQLKENPSEVRIGITELRKQVTDILNDVRALSHDLDSSKLEYLGVIAGMKSWCKEFAERRGLQIDLRNDMQRTLPSELGLCLFRVLQEALHNAAKHSGVKRIEVQLQEESGEIHLIIKDSGRGFDVAAVQGKGLGLSNMRERVRLVNGKMTIDSKTMGGTTIHVNLPLTSPSDCVPQ